jgi:uncharacterized protein (TIGR00369 family)
MHNAPVWRWMRMRVREAADGQAVVEMTLSDDVFQIYGQVHGGILGTLLDSAMAAAIATVTGPDSQDVTTHMSVTFLRPARTGPLVARGAVRLRQGRRVVADATIFDPHDEAVAYASAEFAVRPRTPGSSGSA